MESNKGNVQKISVKASNFWKPRSKKIKRMSIALRAFIAAIGGAQYIQQRVDLAFWVLASGAAIDLFLEFLEISESE